MVVRSTPVFQHSVNLYSKDYKLQLPFNSTKDELKVTKAGQLILLRVNKYNKIKNADIQVKTGCKWSAKEVVSIAESNLRHQDCVGCVFVCCLGMRCITSTKRGEH